LVFEVENPIQSGKIAVLDDDALQLQAGLRIGPGDRVLRAGVIESLGLRHLLPNGQQFGGGPTAVNERERRLGA
jgi:hypothetical protein